MKTSESIFGQNEVNPEDLQTQSTRARQPGYRTGEEQILKIVGMSIVKGMNASQIGRELNSDSRSIRRVLARYGLTSQNRKLLRQTAEDQIGTSAQSRSRYPWDDWQDDEEQEQEPMMPSSPQSAQLAPTQPVTPSPIAQKKISPMMKPPIQNPLKSAFRQEPTFWDKFKSRKQE